MENPYASYASQHPIDHAAVLDRDVPEVPAVGSPPFEPAEPTASRTSHVSLLAATALGLAFTTGATDGNVRRLKTLADPDPGTLAQASTAVLEIGVAPRHTRAIAAEILGRAARLAG